VARKRKPRQGSRTTKIGLPPGVPVYVGGARNDPIHVSVFDYDPNRLEELSTCTAADLARLAAAPSVTWVNVDGLHDTALVERLCRAFQVHPLWMEDLVNATARPKAEAMEGQLLVLVRAVGVADEQGMPLISELNGFVLGRGWVLALQEQAGDPWEPLRGRLRAGTSTLRKSHADALLHALLDGIVDTYFLVIERVETEVDELEDAALGGRARDVPARFLSIKADITLLRGAILPLRDAMSTIMRCDDTILGADTRPLWQDLSDHLAQAHEQVEALRERLVEALEIHLAITNHQLNDVMRVLTLVSSVFIPLTFVVGVYGMNFEHMPELAWWWGYPGVWGVMIVIAAGIVAYYRRRGWI
jgi:magnesium transporter